MSAIWKLPWFERIYKLGIVIKGLDGLVEFVAGVAVLISPPLVHRLLSMLIAELGEHNSRPFQFLANNVGRVDADLLKSGLIFLTIFLIVHGIVKLALVYCLLRRIVRAYPVALLILVIFLLYQVYVLIVHPTIAMALFSLLDAVIIWLVWEEYQELKVRTSVDAQKTETE